MKILALDLGKFKTVSVVSNGGEPKFVTLATDRREFAKLFQRERPGVVVNSRDPRAERFPQSR